MTFSARETSRSLGQPDTLFRFGVGDTVYAYTDSERPIDFGGETYRPIPISRNAIVASGTLDRQTINITLPISAEIVELFRVFPPSDVVGVTIFQGHHGESEFLAMFVGRVVSAGRKGRTATLNCEPASTSMKRPGLRRRWQYGCPHVLYGKQCRANRDSFVFTTEVIEVAAPNVTVVDGWSGALDPLKFENGIIQWDGANGTEVRNILSADIDVFTVSGRLSSLTPGMTVKMWPGCDRTMDDCRGVFNNIHNYGGQPWIPTQNPIGFVNRFY